MIFITVGSQKFQFNRLLRKIDDLIQNGVIAEKVFAQVGYSDYIPRNFAYKQFLDREEFAAMLTHADKLEEALMTVRKTQYKSYQSSTKDIINSIIKFIESD